jgi:hypothetical protein
MTPQQPPRSTGDADLIALAAAIAADHSPELHPIDLIVAARYGFTSDQAQTILDAPHLLSRLTRFWRSHPPTGAIMQSAQSGDATGKAHLKLLQRTGHIINVRSRSQHALAASTAGLPEILTDDHSENAGTVVVRRIFHDQGVMDFAIESADIQAGDSFPVIALLALGEDEPPVTRLLFLLIPAGPGVPAVSHAESFCWMVPSRLCCTSNIHRSTSRACLGSITCSSYWAFNCPKCLHLCQPVTGKLSSCTSKGRCGSPPMCGVSRPAGLIGVQSRRPWADCTPSRSTYLLGRDTSDLATCRFHRSGKCQQPSSAGYR